MAPLLSIVCPFYGVEAYLGECLDSLRAQTLPDFEVILVDDGSPDNCRMIAESVVAADPRFTLIVQPNAGLGAARNTGTAQATGKYLTFVDSDDVVPPRAYELMVSTLERTGSDFCAGNAGRFGGTLGPRQSWTHRNAFAVNRLGTHVREYPELIADRMVWNKVYRRSFWDERGYEFPAIRYEDYPVTLAAHLAANAVDVVADRIYLWRERDSNDSITQMSSSVDNARDRVQSAHMVLNLLGQESNQRVVEKVHTYFVDIDLIALAGALLHAADEDKPEIQELIVGLARRLDVSRGNPQRLAKLVHEGALRNDFVLVEALARWRAGGDTAALLKMLVRHLPLDQWRHVRAAVVRRRPLPKIKGEAKRLKTEVQRIDVTDDGFSIVARTKLRRQFASAAQLTVTVGNGHESVEVPVQKKVNGNGFDLRIDVPFATVASLTPDLTGVPLAESTAVDMRCLLSVDVRVGPLRWHGTLKTEPELVTHLVPTSQGVWMQAARQSHSWSLYVITVAEPVLLTDAELVDTTLVTQWSLSDGAVTVHMPKPTPHRHYPLVDGRCEIDLADLVAHDPLDDPITKLGQRFLSVEVAGHDKLPYVAHRGVTGLIEGRIVRLSASATGRAQLTYQPTELTPVPVADLSGGE